MHCTICHNETNNQIHTFREMMFGTREEFDYLECRNCHTIQIMTVPDDIAKHYPTDYYSLTGTTPDAVYASPLRAWLERARTRSAVFGTGGMIGNMLFHRYPDGAPASLFFLDTLSLESKILDVGCGTGRLLYDLREIGFSHTVGIDPYLTAPISYSNGLEIHNHSIDECDGTYDVIMLHHVFEHLAHPEAYLRSLRSKLTDTGTIIIRIPIAGCQAWETYGKNWVQLDAPRHFFLHTPLGMDILAGKSGLSLEEIIFDSRDFQFWGSEQYQQDIPLMDERSLAVNPHSSLFSKQQRNAWKRAAQALNQNARGDQACFYLRKA